MNRSKAVVRMVVLVSALAVGAGAGGHALRAQTAATAGAPAILTRDQAAAILPPSVFFRGQTASIQGRNSAGLRGAGGRLVLAALVDTSGYSSGVAQTYQGCLMTEVSLRLGEQMLRPGAYGFGFVADDRMVVMDLGGNVVLHAPITRDGNLKRPTPLQILADPAKPDEFRLYLGRSYVSLRITAESQTTAR